MISEDAARDLLRPLALPTLRALDDANEVTRLMREVSADARARARTPLLANHDGNSFWAFFASAVCEEYEAVPGVERVPLTHPLVTEWTLPGGVLLRLKSDVAAVDGSQLSLDIDVPSVGGEIIVLTYDNEGPERIAPTFVQPLSKTHQAWTWSARRLLLSAEPAPAVVRAPRPRTTISSTKPASERREQPGPEPESGSDASPDRA